MRSRFFVAALLLSSLSGTTYAQSSADDVKKAGDEFDQGKRAYKNKNWVDAAEHFEAADGLAPSPIAIEWAMRARDKADQLDRAATLASITKTRHADRADLVKLADGLLKRARGKLAEVKVHCAPACGLVIGTKLVPGGPTTDRVLFLPPGSAELHASWSGGRTRTAQVLGAKGTPEEVSFTAPPEEKVGTAEPAVGGAVTSAGKSDSKPTAQTTSSGERPEKDKPHEEAGSGLPPVIFFIGAGLTAAAGGVTIWSGLDTQKNPGADRVREECAGQGENCALYQDGLKRQRRTNVLLAVTGGLALTTTVIGALFTNWKGAPEEKAARVEPWVGIGFSGRAGEFLSGGRSLDRCRQ